MDNRASNDEEVIVAGYGRVSTQKQVIEGTSAEDQKKRIINECKKNNWNLYKFYSDDGFSGRTMKHRPGIQELIKDAKDGNFNTILFTNLDRVGRSLRELLNFWKLMQEEYNLNLICIDMPLINTNDPLGEMMLAVFGGFAKFERALIRERMSRGRLFKWKERKSVVGALPYGYKWEEGTVKEHLDEAPIVKRIYSMYIHENYSMKDIAIKLTEDGIPTPSVGKDWKKTASAYRWNNYTIGKILKNRAYTGQQIILNKYKRATAVSKRSKREYMYVIDELKPQSEWVPISYPPLITDEWWELSQQRRKHQKRKPKKKHVEYKDHFLAENAVYCGECFSRMRKRLKKDKTKKGEITRFYYVCYWKGCTSKDLKIKGRDRCTLNSVDAELVDRDIWREIVMVLSNPAKYAEQWFINPDIDELNKRLAKLKADEESAKQRSVAGYKNLARIMDPELKLTCEKEWEKFQAEFVRSKVLREKAEFELKAVSNKIDLLSEFKKDMEREAMRPENERWYNGDTLESYSKNIRKFLFSLPFKEKKRIIEAVISPESGGRVFVRYQIPADYVDYEDEMNLEPDLLNKPQLDRPKIVDFRFHLDLERIKSIITGLNKKDLLSKFDSFRVAGRLYGLNRWWRFFG